MTQTIASQMEILVVDNHSDDESIAFIRAQLTGKPNVKIIEERDNIGYGRGNNAAAKIAKGKYLLILNPDNVLPKDGAEKMLSFLEKHADAGVVGPALLYPDGTVRPSARQFPHPLDLLRKRLFPGHWHSTFDAERTLKERKESVEVDWLVGACLMMKTEFFLSLGGFDPRYFLFFEDIDLCRRIKNAGKKVIYLPSLHVLDRKGRLSGSSVFSIFTRKTTRIHLHSALKYFWKWGL
jgi:GT2 family glycosyltransferase